MSNVQFLTGYNPSHLAGAGDLIESASQLLGSPINNYDLNTILLQIQPQVTTRKILLLGHSQGTFYTNEIYNYLISHGESKDSVGVYNIATPASFVSGGGAYLTSENDKVINSVRAVAQKIKVEPPLPANVNIPLAQEEAANSFGGHSFGGVYLANDSVRIVSDVEKAIKKLTASEVANAADSSCFIPPKKTLTYFIQAPVFAVADAAANSLVAVNGAISNSLAAIKNLAGGSSADLVSVFSNEDGNLKLAKTVSLAEPREAAAIDKINKTGAIYQTNTADNQDENLAEQQAPAANPIQAPLSANITGQSQGLIGQGEKTFPNCAFNTDKSATRQNLIINEVAWMGGLASANDEWFELKNISGKDLDISGWQILDKAEQIKIKFPNNTKVGAGGLLLLERTDDSSVPGIAADVIYSGALSNTDEGLRLFDNQCNLTDEVLASPNWPAGDGDARKTMERAADLSWHTGIVSGTPKAENSIPVMAQQEAAPSPAGPPTGGDSTPPPAPVSTSTPAPAPAPAPTTTPVVPPTPVNNGANHAVISEILFDAEGSDTGKEFIELYNPTDQPVDLSGWSIQNLSDSGNLAKKNFESGNAIAPKGFFLIWLGNDPRADLVWASGSLNNTGTAIYLADNNQLISTSTPVAVDSVKYDVNQLTGFVPGQSIERKAFQDGCVSAQNAGEYLGNGCDTDSDSDFELRTAPNPQNSRNLAEPRLAPAAVQNFQVLVSSNPGLNFNWDATSSLIYKLYDVSGASSTLLAATSTGQFSESIKEIGRNYKFEITATDKDGLTSSSTQAGIFAPSFLDNLAFYQDPRSSSSSPTYLLDLSWSKYPFVPAGDKWHTVIFYYNREAPVTDDLFWIDYTYAAPYKAWGLVAPGGFKISYPNCIGGVTNATALILPDAGKYCDSLAANYASYDLNWNQLEDQHLLLPAVASNFASGTPAADKDFVTAAFYTFQPGYEPNNSGSRLVAIDKTRHFLQSNPLVHQPPTAPANLQFNFASSTSALTISWNKSSDPDTLDSLINYEINYGSTTVVSSKNSFSLTAGLGKIYNFAIKAKDEFGNLSDATNFNWTPQ